MMSRLDRAAMEEWRPVVGFEGRYEVSDSGQVRTLETRRKRNYMRVMARQVSSHGYLCVTLRDASGKRYAKTIHRLVAEAFLGPAAPGMHVAHNDGDRMNAALSNLRYATPKENQADRELHGTVPRGDRNGTRTHPERLRRGELNPASKLTRATVSALRADYASGMGQVRLARKYSLSRGTVWSIVTGKTWSDR